MDAHARAEKFRSKAQKEDVFRSHQQYCRYLYYLGRIRAIQLEYSEARDCLQQSAKMLNYAAKVPCRNQGPAIEVCEDAQLTLLPRCPVATRA
eukprot:1142366-Pelagomonas_calceolata.AAC.3